MKRKLLTAFFNCGDDQIIQFAMIRAHLNAREKEVILLMMDECLTQEEVAERLDYSVRRVQEFWYSGANKLLNIKWVDAFSRQLINTY